MREKKDHKNGNNNNKNLVVYHYISKIIEIYKLKYNFDCKK